MKHLIRLSRSNLQYSIPRPRIQSHLATLICAAVFHRSQTLSPSPKSFSLMANRSTLVKPPPLDSAKSSIENVLELTDLSVIGPVSLSLMLCCTEKPILSPSQLHNLRLTYLPPGYLYKHQAPLASPRSPRNLRRRRNRTMSRSSPTNSPTQLHSPQHALLLCLSRRQRDTGHVLRRARP